MPSFRSLTRRPLVLVALVAALAGCAPPILTVEVLPPRTSVTCAAPAVGDPALGRGLLDVAAAETERGGYLADLRLIVTGADARVSGVDLTFTGDLSDVAGAHDGEVLMGDVALVGEGDDIRRAVLENVELVSGELADQLNAGTAISATAYQTLAIEILPMFASVGEVEATVNTFALDVCKGCLVAAPTTDECPAGAARNPVCRVGQDVELYSCAQPTGGLP